MGFFYGVFFAIAAAIYGLAAYIAYDRWATRRWPRDVGRVLSHRIEIEEDDESVGYKPGLTYGYVVDGVAHESRRIWKGHSRRLFLSKRAVERWLAERPIGSYIAISRNARAPEEAVVDPEGSPLILRLTLAFGLVALAPPVIVLAVVG